MAFNFLPILVVILWFAFIFLLPAMLLHAQMIKISKNEWINTNYITNIKAAATNKCEIMAIGASNFDNHPITTYYDLNLSCDKFLFELNHNNNFQQYSK
ncbi:hypothetical protein ACFX5K_03725 [Rickettsiales bacterium LUAb2]